MPSITQGGHFGMHNPWSSVRDSTGANVAGIWRPGAHPVICVHWEKACQKDLSTNGTV